MSNSQNYAVQCTDGLWARISKSSEAHDVELSCLEMTTFGSPEESCTRNPSRMTGGKNFLRRDTSESAPPMVPEASEVRLRHGPGTHERKCTNPIRI